MKEEPTQISIFIAPGVNSWSSYFSNARPSAFVLFFSFYVSEPIVPRASKANPLHAHLLSRKSIKTCERLHKLSAIEDLRADCWKKITTVKWPQQQNANIGVSTDCIILLQKSKNANLYLIIENSFSIGICSLFSKVLLVMTDHLVRQLFIILRYSIIYLIIKIYDIIDYR